MTTREYYHDYIEIFIHLSLFTHHIQGGGGKKKQKGAKSKLDPEELEAKRGEIYLIFTTSKFFDLP